MKHTGHGASLRPAKEQAKARERRRGTRPPRTTGPSPALGTGWVGAWHLDVSDTGDLVAINEDTGVTRLVAAAQTEGGEDHS